MSSSAVTGTVAYIARGDNNSNVSITNATLMNTCLITGTIDLSIQKSAASVMSQTSTVKAVAADFTLTRPVVVPSGSTLQIIAQPFIAEPNTNIFMSVPGACVVLPFTGTPTPSTTLRETGVLGTPTTVGDVTTTISTTTSDTINPQIVSGITSGLNIVIPTLSRLILVFYPVIRDALGNLITFPVTTTSTIISTTTIRRITIITIGIPPFQGTSVDRVIIGINVETTTTTANLNTPVIMGTADGSINLL